MTLYTDGTIEATKLEILTCLAEVKAVESVDAQVVADALQAVIDADAKLSLQGISVGPDATAAARCVITFPTDQSAPYFWAGVAAQFAKASGASKVSTYVVRLSAKRAEALLAEVAAVL